MAFVNRKLPLVSKLVFVSAVQLVRGISRLVEVNT